MSVIYHLLIQKHHIQIKHLIMYQRHLKSMKAFCFTQIPTTYTLCSIQLFTFYKALLLNYVKISRAQILQKYFPGNQIRKIYNNIFGKWPMVAWSISIVIPALLTRIWHGRWFFTNQVSWRSPLSLFVSVEIALL